MTTIEPSAVRTYRSGVVVALPRAVTRAEIAARCSTFRAEADRLGEGREAVVAVFGFDAPIGETALAVSHIGATAAQARPDIALLLEADVVDAVRIDSYVTPSAPQAALRAEIVLLRIARDIANVYEGLVCDDVGAVYEPDELDDLVSSVATRETSFAFVAAAASRVDALSAYDAPKAFALPTFDIADSPSDCAPDIALAAASVFVVMAPHVPLITATRIAVVAAAMLPIVVFGPNLLDRDAAVLQAAGIAVYRSIDALVAAFEHMSPQQRERLMPAGAFGRDEIVLFAQSDLTRTHVRTALSRKTLEVADLAAAGASDQPTIVVFDEVRWQRAIPSRIARFAFANTVLDIYDLDVSEAHPLLSALLAVRPELEGALRSTISRAVICESLSREDAGAGDADAFAVAVLADLASDVRGIAQDDAGALFDRRTLVRLAIARRGRGESWNERVARAQLFRRGA